MDGQTKRGCKGWTKTLLPRITLVSYFTKYNARGNWQDKLAGDVTAGLILTVMLIPLGLAYSQLAGLPPVYGLYCSIACLILYPFFGTSPYTIVGPTAITGILVGSTIPSVFPEAETNPDRAVEVAVTLAFAMGVIQLVLGLVHAGYVANFLSRPVLRGFTAGAAVTIAVSQVSKLLGYEVQRSEYVYIRLYRMFRDIENTDWRTVLLAIENFVALYGLKELKSFLLKRKCVKRSSGRTLAIRSIPNALIVVIFNILVVYGSGAYEHGVSILGSIPEGYPSPQNIFTGAFASDFVELLPAAAILSLISFMSTISVGKTMALRFGGDVDGNQEMMALGWANAIGAFFYAFPSSGSFSSSAVNADAGARTPLAGMITAVFLIITVFFLTPLFYYLPDVTLACLVIFAVIKLMDLRIAKRLWRVDRTDFFIFWFAFIATLALGIQNGLLVGAGVSILRVIQQAARPHKAILGRTEKGTWRNRRRFKTTEIPDIRVFRMDSHMSFVNVAFFKDMMYKLAMPEIRLDPSSLPPRAIIVDCSCIGTIDSSGVDTIEELPELLLTAMRRLKAARETHFRRAVRNLRKGKAYKPPTAMNPAYYASLEAAQEQLQKAISTELQPPVVVYTTLRGKVRDRLAGMREHRKNELLKELRAKKKGEHRRRFCSCCKEPAAASSTNAANFQGDAEGYVDTDVSSKKDLKTLVQMQQTDLGLLEVNEAVEAVQRLIEQSVLSEEPDDISLVVDSDSSPRPNSKGFGDFEEKKD